MRSTLLRRQPPSQYCSNFPLPWLPASFILLPLYSAVIGIIWCNTLKLSSKIGIPGYSQKKVYFCDWRWRGRFRNEEVEVEWRLVLCHTSTSSSCSGSFEVEAHTWDRSRVQNPPAGLWSLQLRHSFFLFSVLLRTYNDKIRFSRVLPCFALDH